ncbi:MAG: hypothetical protein P8Y23_14065 [Candidatus Lokiarchaeota archaeon]|jgi:hypothetical protein
MEFIDYIRNNCSEYKIISIIGLAKNVSKTTTLNYIIKNFPSQYQLGLTSIGRDGEKYDIISEFPKPRIKIRKGTLVATAEKSLKNSDIETHRIKNTEISTPMGEVLILEALSDGFIELAGPSNNTGVKKVCGELLDLRCNLVLIDGAFDRRSFASPLISDATILSTGASVSKRMDKVIKITTHTLNLLSIETEKNLKIRAIIEKDLKNNKVMMIFNNGSIKKLDLATAFASGEDIAKELTENTDYIVINGAITDRLLEVIMQSTEHYVGVTFIVENATKLFINLNTYNKFLETGGIIKVLYPINVIALTINPTSPYGYNFDKNTFLKVLQNKIKIPIFDLGPN